MLGNMTTFCSLCIAERGKNEYGIPQEIMREVKHFRVWRGGKGAITYSGWSREKKTTENDTEIYSSLELFRFRVFKDYTVTTANFLIFNGDIGPDKTVTGGERFDIQAVESIAGKGMYLEVLGKRVEQTMGGKV